ncbi:PKD domain-containing protein [Candidatus Woesebacteria bacterium]|nr:PKD domain-containing protein [Candidatus Woesebacteria bacterium]
MKNIITIFIAVTALFSFSPHVQAQMPVNNIVCNNLQVTKGNNGTIPATVEFSAEVEDPLSQAAEYLFYFGDGNSAISQTPNISHTYQTSGTFTVRTEVKDTTGYWKTSRDCQTTAIVEKSTVEDHKSGCSNIFVEIDNNGETPTNATFQVTGWDNTGILQGYSIDFGDGMGGEYTQPYFSHIYDKPGTYVVQAKVQDSQGNWIGATDGCSINLPIKSAAITNLQTQPSTGSPTIFAVASVIGVLFAIFTLRSTRHTT